MSSGRTGQQSRGGAPTSSKRTRYTIVDPETLEVVAIHVREDGESKKRFHWEQPDGTVGLGGRRAADLPLYGGEVLRSDSPSTVILVEGEKAAAALMTRRVPAVGTVTGAGPIPSDDVLRTLIPHDVVTWADHDDVGRLHMARIAERLVALGGRARMLRWAGATEPGDDAADYLARGGTLEELKAMIVAAEPRAPNMDDGCSGSDEPRGIIASNVRRERVLWLWPGRVPLGKMTIISGDPDRGKTTVAIDIAARVTQGRLMPDGTSGLGAPFGVVLASAEDDAGDTLRPRLEAAEADLSRVLILRLHELPTIPDDLDSIESAVGRVQARLVIIDPLTAFLADRTDAHRDHHIRRSLTPLAERAARLGVAVVLIRHLNKSQTMTNAQYRGGGSIGITGACRSELLVAADPDDKTAERRVLARIKANLAAPVPSLTYRLVPRELEPLPDDDDASPHWSVAVEWLGESDRTADQLLARPDSPEERSAIDATVDYLETALAGGPKTAAEIHAGARASGISRATLSRAFQMAAVRARQAPWGDWYWSSAESGETYYPAEPPPSRVDRTEGRHHAEEVAALRLAEIVAVSELTRARAEELLQRGTRLARAQARDVIERHAGGLWEIVPGGGRGRPTILRRPGYKNPAAPVSVSEPLHVRHPGGEVFGGDGEPAKTVGETSIPRPNGHTGETSPPHRLTTDGAKDETPDGAVSGDADELEVALAGGGR